MKVKPILDKVIVKREKADEVTKGGIYIPQIAREENVFAKVVSVGPGRYSSTGARIEPSVKEGDRVVVDKWVGQEVIIDDEKCIAIKEESISLVIEE